jgi:HSP90 family molecular chaperone
MIEDGANRARLTKLLRYKSSKSENELISLEQYVERMPDSQKSIFYITGASLDKIKQAAVLEDAIKRDIEVLYMTDAIDEYVVQHVTDFAGKKLVDLRKDVKLEELTKNQKAIEKKRNEKYEPLIKWFKDMLGERVTKVQLTSRKISEPLLVVSPQHGMTANMLRIVAAQTLGEKNAENDAKRVLEINYLHPLIDEIFKRVKADEGDKVAEDCAMVLFETSSLVNGFEIYDALGFSKRVGRLLRQSVDIAADAPLLEEDVSQYAIEEEPEEEAQEATEEPKEPPREDEPPKEEL